MKGQLNMTDSRVAAWYDAVAEHSENGRCTNERDCPGCAKLLRRRDALRAIPGLLVTK